MAESTPIKVLAVTQQETVEEFHRAFDPESIAKTPGWPDRDGVLLRWRLMDEEWMEVLHEMRLYLEGRQNPKDALTAVVKELADLLYVIYGTGVALGVDLDLALQIVHASNMTKLWSEEDLATLSGDEGKLTAVATEYGVAVYREDGKVMKPPSYEAPLDLLKTLIWRDGA